MTTNNAEALRALCEELVSQWRTGILNGEDAMNELGQALAQPQAAGAGGDAVLRELYEAVMQDNGTGESRQRRWAAQDKARDYLAATPAPAVAQDDARAVEVAARALVAKLRTPGGSQWWQEAEALERALATRPSAAPGPSAGEAVDETVWPRSVMLTSRDLHDDKTGARILTTAGFGYEKRRYVREDAARQARGAAVEAVCTCPSGDGSLRWPCPRHRDECRTPGRGGEDAS